MNNLAILLLCSLPFISYSQNENMYVESPTLVIVEQYTKKLPNRNTATNQLPIYTEDDFKMFYDVTDYAVDKKTKHTATYQLPNYTEDDFKMFYDVTEHSFENITNKSASNNKKETVENKPYYTRIIRVYENPKVYYELEVEEVLDVDNKVIYKYNEPINHGSKTLLDVHHRLR